MALTDPVPSQAIDVFKRNMEDSDRFVNQTSGTVTNRTGKTMRPLPVISDDIEQQITDLTADINAAKADLYPIVKFRFLVDTYEITNRNELGDTATGETYRYVGATLPFNVTPSTNPVGNPDFVQVIQTDHNNLTNRNAVGAHSASSISYTESGDNTVESALMGRAAHLTLAQAQASYLRDGQYVRLKDYGDNIVKVSSSVSDNSLVDFSIGSLFLNTETPAVLVGPNADESTIKTKTTVSVKDKVRLKDVIASGLTVQPTNDNAVISIGRADGAIVSNVEVSNGYNSFTFGYGYLPPAGEERRTVKSALCNSVVRGHYIGYEAFSLAYSSISGVVAASNHPTRGIQHGLRITGYGEDHLGQGHDLRNRGNNYSVVSHNYSNGVSLQAGCYGNNVNFSATESQNGLHHSPNTTLPDAISSSNNFTFAIDGCAYGSFLYDPKSNSYRGTIRGASNLSWNTVAGDRESKNNSYDLTITECDSGGIFVDSYSRIYITASDLQKGGYEIRGSFNIVDVVIEDINMSGTVLSALVISGDSNIVRVTTGNIRQQFSELIISGDNNEVTCNLDISGSKGNVAVTGSKNIIRGRCKITAASSSDNDYSSVTGWSGQGSVSITTNAAGVADLGIHAGMPQSVSGYSLALSCTEFTNPRIVTRKGTNDQFIVTDAQTGAIVGNTTTSIIYHYAAFK